MPRAKRPVGHSDEKPLRVLTVSGAYPTKEIPHWGTFIKSQVDSLIAAGVEVDVIHPKPKPTFLRYATAIAHVFLRTLTGRYDVVHGHYGLWGLVARMQWTTPVVVSFLGDDLLGTPSAANETTPKSAAVVRMSQWLSKRVQAVIVKSEEMRRLTPSKRVFVIPNGVDFALFHPVPRAEARAKLGWNPDGYYILFANDPGLPVKDYPLAQAAVARLRAKGAPAELVTANGQPHESMVWCINASNALLLTSIHEGSPNVVKEAMACNVPVVATNVGDVEQVIGQTGGCYICPRDADTIAEKLLKALQRDAPTTGRDDIAYLECSVVAQRIVEVYEYASRQAKRDKQSVLALSLNR